MLEGWFSFSRASFIVDFVMVGTLALLPLLALSIALARKYGNYALHRRVQIALSLVLGLTIVLFEIEVRVYGWRHLAEASPHYDSLVFPSLAVHVLCSISATILWIIVLWGAIKRFPSPPAPSEHSPRHRRLAWLAVFAMGATALTSVVFYYLAFVA